MPFLLRRRLVELDVSEGCVVVNLVELQAESRYLMMPEMVVVSYQLLLEGCFGVRC